MDLEKRTARYYLIEKYHNLPFSTHPSPQIFQHSFQDEGGPHQLDRSYWFPAAAKVHHGSAQSNIDIITTNCDLHNYQNYPHTIESVIRGFWLRSWSEDLDVHTVEDITAVASKAGLDSHQIGHCLEEMKAEEVKTVLKQVTAEAVERGAFGAPTMFFSQQGEREHMFWGSDRSVRAATA